MLAYRLYDKELKCKSVKDFIDVAVLFEINWIVHFKPLINTYY